MSQTVEMTPDICARFAALRAEQPGKMSRDEFGAILSVSGSTVQNLEVPGRMKRLGLDFVAHTCEVLNISREWLLTGEGEMYRTGIIPELTQVLRHNPALEAMLGAMLDKMGPEDWDALNRIVEKAMKKEQP